MVYFRERSTNEASPEPVEWFSGVNPTDEGSFEPV